MSLVFHGIVTDLKSSVAAKFKQYCTCQIKGHHP